MQIDILTLFPEMFTGPFDNSIVKRAQNKNKAVINIHNLRDWSTDSYKTVDDRPYGGGVGMIMKVDIIDRALKDLGAGVNKKVKAKTILFDATGKTFTQQDAVRLSKEKRLVFICGHYEGVDHRVHEHLADEVISIGDYVLTGGEIPAMVVTDSIVRLIPGVLDKPDAIRYESFSILSGKPDGKPTAKLEYPQYTRPENYRGWKVPEILLSGNHKEIEKWKVDNTASKKD